MPAVAGPPVSSPAHSLACGTLGGTSDPAGSTAALTPTPLNAEQAEEEGRRGLARLTVGVGGIWEVEGSWVSLSLSLF